MRKDLKGSVKSYDLKMKLKTILNDEDLQRKEKILLFCNEYGIVPTIRAYEISKSTLYILK